MAWWRAHDESVDDPKLQRLPDALFKAWFNLLCITSRNGGKLPPLADICFVLRKSDKEVTRILDALLAAKLFDVTEDGIEPHNWKGRQYQSDNSTNRVRQFRKRQKERSNGTGETVSRNGPEQSRAEQTGAPPKGRTPDEPQKSSPIAAREDGPNGRADAHGIVSNLSKKLRPT